MHFTLTTGSTCWPGALFERLGKSSPRVLNAIGPSVLLRNTKTALFCSARAPGGAILRAHDTARRLRDENATVISGFHSPIEKDCLGILLRGRQPIIFCLARAIVGMRIPSECRAAFDAGRVLFLSPFVQLPRRVSRASALRRNEVVAALADEVFIAHITPGGETARIAEMLKKWGVTFV
jgi:predicted Rossmann fold nucleotide-binding protein DprA/Smf involved in DNA uptake